MRRAITITALLTLCVALARPRLEGRERDAPVPPGPAILEALRSGLGDPDRGVRFAASPSPVAISVCSAT